MMNFACSGLGAFCFLLTACSGNVSNDPAQAGGTRATTNAGGAHSTGSTLSLGGATSSVSSLGLGGTLPASGGASAIATNTGETHSVNCAMAGCAQPPLCSTGCRDACGCCPCSEGTLQGNLICKGGCWAETGTGGTSTIGGTPSTGGKIAIGGYESTGGVSNDGSGLGTTANGVCGTGCTFESTTSPFCTSGLVSLFCSGGVDFQVVSAKITSNGCTIGASDAIRFCCPPAILTECH